MNRKMLIQLLKSGVLVTLIAVVSGFAAGERKALVCRSLDVNVEQLSGVYFIDESAVIAHVFDSGVPIIGEAMDAINLVKIREALQELPSVKEATVYGRFDGRLVVDITQRMPLLRVVGNDKPGYYIDTEGQPMPLSSSYSALVPVVTGKLPLELGDDTEAVAQHPNVKAAFELVKYINERPFWKSQIEHIVVLPGGDFELVPRVGGARVVLGDLRELDNKFDRLMAFYKTMSAKGNLNTYKRINLKYRDQVVCERYF